ncbi:MAG: acyltransferase [Deltaproteobacteria bacterium]|nr:acyltransferase [Deltaproteobacteria bacterium]
MEGPRRAHLSLVADPHARIRELDGVRGIAVLLVLLFHFFSWSMGQTGWSGLPLLIENLSRMGWSGVNLFFVLSGFLITRILLKNRTQPNYYRSFYLRRALRILPLYYLTVLICLFYPGGAAFAGVSALHLSNMAPILGVVMVHPGLWSLSVEEHFYLVWPTIVKRLSLKGLAHCCALLCLFVPCLRMYFHDHATSSYTWFRVDSLAWGALLGMAYDHFTSSSARYRLALAAFATGSLILLLGWRLGVTTRNSVLGAGLQFTFLDLLYSSFILTAIANPSGNFLARTLRAWPLQRLGDLSYCLYLIHQPLLSLYEWIVPKPEQIGSALFSYLTLRAVVVLATACGLASLSERFFEKPIQRLRSRPTQRPTFANAA